MVKNSGVLLCEHGSGVYYPMVLESEVQYFRVTRMQPLYCMVVIVNYL